VPFAVAIDTPWKGTFRQKLGRVVMRKFFSRMSAAMVSGERSAELASALGFRMHQIHRGIYGLDYELFRAVGARRAKPFPRKFLFVGRYVEEKALDVLVSGYRRYREHSSRPWGLVTCGQGPLKPLLSGAEGIEDRGFTQPEALPRVLEECGAFVLPSRYEPWGVALAEAGAAGLPLICTDAVCSGLDLVRSYYNGVVVPTDDVEALAGAMSWIEGNEEILDELGERSAVYAGAYAAPVWGERWATMLALMNAEKV
jgi:glycosyltransferase involved in cell wall biosynthesis